MKIMLVHPGAEWSVHDVFVGLDAALKRQGVTVVEYSLDKRIAAAGDWLMRQWKRANKKITKPTPADIVYQAGVGMLERALRHEVDWVFIITSMYVHPETMLLLRKAGLRVAILFTESPNDDEWQLRFAPIAQARWVNERTSVAKFPPGTHYWQHAINPEIHSRRLDDNDVPAHDVVFVGTGFVERCELLSAIDWTGIDLGLYGSWQLLGSRNPLRKYIKGDIIPNERANALYQRAKIGLNIHRTSRGFGREVDHITDAESINPRCYELAAAGSFFITDYRAELTDVFGDWVPTFTDATEAEGLIRCYLGNEQTRQEIAAALPECVESHTFDNRASDILEILGG